MSAMLSLPERPVEARWKGGRVRSGQGMMVAVVILKWDGRFVLRSEARSWRGGGFRGRVLRGKEGDVILRVLMF